jgi:hypothetical protein
MSLDCQTNDKPICASKSGSILFPSHRGFQLSQMACSSDFMIRRWLNQSGCHVKCQSTHQFSVVLWLDHGNLRALVHGISFHREQIQTHTDIWMVVRLIRSPKSINNRIVFPDRQQYKNNVQSLLSNKRREGMPESEMSKSSTKTS